MRPTRSSVTFSATTFGLDFMARPARCLSVTVAPALCFRLEVRSPARPPDLSATVFETFLDRLDMLSNIWHWSTQPAGAPGEWRRLWHQIRHGADRARARRHRATPCRVRPSPTRTQSGGWCYRCRRSSSPIFLRLTPDRRCGRVLELEPVRRPAGAVARGLSRAVRTLSVCGGSLPNCGTRWY